MEADVPLAHCNTLRLPARAEWSAMVGTGDELREALDFVRTRRPRALRARRWQQRGAARAHRRLRAADAVAGRGVARGSRRARARARRGRGPMAWLRAGLSPPRLARAGKPRADSRHRRRGTDPEHRRLRRRGAGVRRGGRRRGPRKRRKRCGSRTPNAASRTVTASSRANWPSASSSPTSRCGCRARARRAAITRCCARRWRRSRILRPPTCWRR